MKKEINNKKGYKKRSKEVIEFSKVSEKRNRLKAKTFKKSNSNSKKQNFYYSFLTIVLLIFLCQVAFSAILNITKNISYGTKISVIKHSKEEAQRKNNKLRKELKNFSKDESLESIARNNLKMAGNDEVLVIINEIKKQTSEEEKTNKKNFLFNLGKHDR